MNDVFKLGGFDYINRSVNNHYINTFGVRDFKHPVRDGIGVSGTIIKPYSSIYLARSFPFPPFLPFFAVEGVVDVLFFFGKRPPFLIDGSLLLPFPSGGGM